MANGIRTGDPVDSIKDVVRSSVKVPEFDQHPKKAGGHIDRNVVKITIKMKTIVRKPLMIKIQTTVLISWLFCFAAYQQFIFTRHIISFLVNAFNSLVSINNID